MSVVGCGLVGSSFALAMRRAGACVRLAGWDVSEAALDEALRLGIVDEVDGAFAGGGASASDLVYLSMPVGQIVAFLQGPAREVRPGAVVTDAGSTKLEVCRAAASNASRAWRFVGGHPVAGSHLSGPAHARADLFEGAPYVLTGEADGSDPSALSALAETLRLLGARVRVMPAREHDRAMAFLSHLPQLVSGALAAVARDRLDARALRELAGAGYRDLTRLAASPWSVWRDILSTNSAEVADALDALLETLAAARDELRAHGVPSDAARALFDQPQGSRQ